MSYNGKIVKKKNCSTHFWLVTIKSLMPLCFFFSSLFLSFFLLRTIPPNGPFFFLFFFSSSDPLHHQVTNGFLSLSLFFFLVFSFFLFFYFTHSTMFTNQTHNHGSESLVPFETPFISIIGLILDNHIYKPSHHSSLFWFGCLWDYVYMFKRVCICGFWAVGKRKKKSETCSGAGSGREISLLLGCVKWFYGVHRCKIYFLLGFVMVKAEQ